MLAAAAFPAGLEDSPIRASSVVRADQRTGRLVRAVVLPAAERRRLKAAESGREIPEAVKQAAALQGLDPRLVHSVIQAESNYNPFAVSPRGAQGLMQLMPATARRFGAVNSFNIKENLHAGASYLRYLLDLFGDQQLALAAYNAGEGAVVRHGGVPPYPETRRYVSSVSGRYAAARQSGAAMTQAPAGPPAGQPPAFRPIQHYVDPQGNLHILTR